MPSRTELIAILANIGQQIAEAQAVVEDANIPIADWVQINELLCEFEQRREVVEAELSREG